MDDEAATQQPALLARRWVRTGLAIAALAVAAVTVAWVQRFWIAERVAVRYLAQNDIATVELTVERLDFAGATVSNIVIGGGGGQRVAKLEAGYSLGGLWQGTAARLHITGLHLRGRFGPDGPAFAGLPLSSATRKTKAVHLSFRLLDLDSARVDIETPHGPLSLTTTGKIESTDGETADIEATVEFTGKSGSGRGTIAATRLAAGEIYGRVALQDGSAAHETLRAMGIRGAVQFIALSESALDVDANFEIDDLTVAGESLRDAHLNIGARRGPRAASQIAVEASLAHRDGRIEVSGTVIPSTDGVLAASATFAIDITRQAIRANTRGSATLKAGSDGRIAGAIKLEEGDLSYAGKRLSGIAGTAEVVRTPDGEFHGDASLTFQRFGAFGVTGQAGSLSARLDEAGLDFRTSLDWADGKLSIEGKGPRDGPIDISLEGQLDSVQSATDLLDLYHAEGRAAFSFDGTLRDPRNALRQIEIDPMAVFDSLETRGWIDGKLKAVVVPDMLSGGTVSGRIDVASGADGWRVTTKDLRLSAGALEPAVLNTLPAAIRDRIAGPVRAAIGRHGGPSAIARIVRGTDGYETDMNAAIRLSAGGAKLSVRGGVRANLDREGNFRSLDAARTEIELTRRKFGDGAVSARLSITGLQAEGGRVGGAFSLAGTFDGRIDEAHAPLAAKGDLTGRADLNENTLSVTIDSKSAVSLDRVEMADRVKLAAPLTATLEEPLKVRLDIGKGLPSLAYATKFAVPDGAISVKAGKAWHDASISGTAFTVTGSGKNHRIRLKDGLIEAPAQKIHASGIDFDLTVGENIAVKAAINDIRHEAKPAFFKPLRLTASAQGKGDRLDFTARLFDPPERISVRFSGQHDFAASRGKVTIDAQKIAFLPTVLQPAQLFPVLGRKLREVDGEIDGLANLAWHGDRLDSTLELLVTAKSLKTDEFTLGNVASVIRFDSLFPPSTPPKQEISVGTLDMGLPMLNGRVEFQLAPEGRIHAALRELDFFGGRIETEDFTIPETFDGFTVPLLVNGVELENLLALARSGDLSATGTLNGRIPVTIENGAIAVRGGVLESAPGGGSIRYRPTAGGPALTEANEGTALFLKIVDDFQYDKVLVALDEDAFGEVAFRFKIEGRNKAVYKGFPVVLNVSMDGPLRKMLSQGLKTYKLPERLLSQMRRFKDTP